MVPWILNLSKDYCNYFAELNQSSPLSALPGDSRYAEKFDSLAGIVRREMGLEPLQSGDIFIFMNRKRNQVKLLNWEGDGWAIYYKLLEQGSYELPVLPGSSNSCHIRTDELQLILGGISLKSIQQRKRYQKPP